MRAFVVTVTASLSWQVQVPVRALPRGVLAPCGVARRRRDFLNTGVASARVRSDRFAVLSIAIDRCSALEAQVSRHE